MDMSVSLGKLQKGREKRGIAVRIIRKWMVKDNNGEGPPLYVGMVVADANADAMYAEIPKEIIDAKSYILEVGAAYIIKKFRVNSSKTYYRACDGTLMIELTAFTTVELIARPPESMPLYIYSITPFPAIVPTDGAVSRYIDTLGYITRYSAVSSFVPKNKEKVTILREVYLKDIRDNEMKVTLWGDHATNFNIDAVYDKNVGNLVVCLIVGCIPRRLYTDRNKSYLSGSSACAYYLNPDIPEAAPYYSRFKDRSVYIDCPEQTVNQSAPQMAAVPLEEKNIADLDEIDPFDFEDGKYKCSVTIVSIPENTSWWYRSCVPCKKKAEQQPDHRYRCPKCLGYEIMPRYLLSFVGKDETGQANFFAYDEEAKLIIQKDCEMLINPLTMSTGLPQPLQKIIGKTYTFAINLTDDSCKGPFNRQYLVKAVLQRHVRQNIAVDNIAPQLPGQQSNIGASNLLRDTPPRRQISEQGSEVLQIECDPHSTPAPPVESDLHATKNVTYRVETNARKNLFGNYEPAHQELSASPAIQAASEAAAATTSLEPSSKRAKSAAADPSAMQDAEKSA